ncbi:uncharacterized protein LOC133400211 isoform X2 [Phycodurus eques]|uniref:uncharacterized protein LOC133400211 isoform X2 n=1 Tax=Phycodurus eques TaxID=693459 RepID=UPI002ACDFF66|nr:uncharacterized protein LOC133400211 isoform X2 [Phycodurus eques]
MDTSAVKPPSKKKKPEVGVASTPRRRKDVAPRKPQGQWRRTRRTKTSGSRRQESHLLHPRPRSSAEQGYQLCVPLNWPRFHIEHSAAD